MARETVPLLDDVTQDFGLVEITRKDSVKSLLKAEPV